MVITHEYITACLNAYNEVFHLPTIPQIMVVYGDTDYCGMMNIFGIEYGDSVEREVMYIAPDAIEHTANVEGVSHEQMALETIFHEYIHYFNHMVGGELETHTGKIWDSMVTIAIDNNFITREAI